MKTARGERAADRETGKSRKCIICNGLRANTPIYRSWQSIGTPPAAEAHRPGWYWGAYGFGLTGGVGDPRVIAPPAKQHRELSIHLVHQFLSGEFIDIINKIINLAQEIALGKIL